MIKKIFIATAIFLLLACTFALAQEADSESDTSQDQPDEAPSAPLRSPTDLKGTAIFKFHGGAAQTRLVMRWDDNYASIRPLHGSTLVSSGNTTGFALGGWFYPTQSKRFFAIGSLNIEAGETKIHYSGAWWETIDNQFILYGAGHLIGGAGYRMPFGKSQRYSTAWYAQGGPGVAAASVENVTSEMILAGLDFNLGFSVQYQYSFRMLVGGSVEVGYRGYQGQDQALNANWETRDEFVDVTLGSGYLRVGLLIGYDF